MSGARVLVVGSGAREHALCWRLASEGVEVIVAPGNPLMADVARVRGDVALTDLDGLVGFAAGDRVDLVVVGPEAPLVEGLVDRLITAGIAAFGPKADAAQIEASKSFAREVCNAAGVPMATGAAFEDVDEAIQYAETAGGPVVVKADGLAAGKGVAICASLAEAEQSIRAAMEGGRFGEAGTRVVVEQLLAGVEASVIAICDGRDAVILPAARDHKRLLDNDLGPNTGGMGAYSPLPDLNNAALRKLREDVFVPVLREMELRGSPFHGALFAGLMLTADGPRVLEFNARFGDPETQAILPRLDVPLLPLLSGQLSGGPILPVDDSPTVAITLAADGYPDAPRRGDSISGVEAARSAGALVFGAGIGKEVDGRLVTAGGRVVTVVGRGSDLESAAEAAYLAADLITFDGRQMRRDIGRPLAGVSA